MESEKGTVLATRVVMTEIVLPQFTNALDNVFGGQIVSWIDICAAVAASRHCRGTAVTASIDAVDFIEPIRLGQVVVLEGQVNAAFNTSMECGVRVMSEDPSTGSRRHAVSAYATFVAMDASGHPRPVPPLTATTPENQRRMKEAGERRRHRLSMR